LTLGGSCARRLFIFTKDRADVLDLPLDLASGDVTLLTDGGRSQNGRGQWSTAGDRVAYGSTRRNGKDRDVYLMNPADPSSNRLLLQVEGGGWQVADWSPDDTKLAVAELVSINETYLWLVDAATGAKKLITPRGGPEKVAYRGAAFARTGAASASPPTARQIPAPGADRPCPRGAHVPHQRRELGRGKVQAVARRRDDRVRDQRGRRGRAAPARPPAGWRPVPDLGGGLRVINALDWHANSKDLAFTQSSAITTSDVYSLDRARGKVGRWTRKRDRAA
jgi:hypothetical protein